MNVHGEAVKPSQWKHQTGLNFDQDGPWKFIQDQFILAVDAFRRSSEPHELGLNYLMGGEQLGEESIPDTEGTGDIVGMHRVVVTHKDSDMHLLVSEAPYCSKDSHNKAVEVDIPDTDHVDIDPAAAKDIRKRTPKN